MKLGRLSDFVTVSQSVFVGGTDQKIDAIAKYPLHQGGKFKVPWQKVWTAGADIHLTLSSPAFVDRIQVRVIPDAQIFSLTLSDGSDGTVLSSHKAESGKAVTETEIELEAGVFTDHVVLNVISDFSDIEFCGAVLWGAVDPDQRFFPLPDKAEYTGETVPFGLFSSYFHDDLSEKAARVFSEKLFEESGVVSEEKDEGFVQFLADPSLGYNAYRVSVTKDGARLSASDERGFVMAAEALVKLFDKSGVVCAEVAHAPAFPMRGVHIYLPAEEEMDFCKRLIKYFISPLEYNMLIIELAGAFEYKSHPEINEITCDAIEKGKKGLLPPFPHGSVGGGKTVPQEKVAELVDYIRSFGIEPVPEVQSLGHVQFMTYAHPEIAEVEEEKEAEEVDTRVEDARPKKFYRHCYCPSNPESYRILFDLLDEVIRVFRPKEYVHMGHDEVYEIGVCKVCKKRDPAELLAEDIIKIHGHLKEKGLKMMIWSDMLQPVTKYRTPRARLMIPKDILLLDFIWYFHMDKNIEENLLEEGFKVAVGNLYSSHYPRFKERMRKRGMVGGQISGWCGTNAQALAQEGKFYDFALTAQMLTQKNYLPELTLFYDSVISEKMPRYREKLERISFPSLKEGTKKTCLWEKSLSYPPKYEPFAKISVEKKAKSVILEHFATRRVLREPWKKPVVAGEYLFSYSDGTVEKFPVAIGKNVGFYGRRQHAAIEHALFRHNGYTTVFHCTSRYSKGPAGEDMTVYIAEAVTDPEKTLESISFAESDGVDAKITVCGVSIIE